MAGAGCGEVDRGELTEKTLTAASRLDVARRTAQHHFAPTVRMLDSVTLQRFLSLPPCRLLHQGIVFKCSVHQSPEQSPKQSPKSSIFRQYLDSAFSAFPTLNPLSPVPNFLASTPPDGTPPMAQSARPFFRRGRSNRIPAGSFASLVSFFFCFFCESAGTDQMCPGHIL